MSGYGYTQGQPMPQGPYGNPGNAGYPPAQQGGYPPAQQGGYPPAQQGVAMGPGAPGAWQPSMGGEIPNDDTEAPVPQLPQFEGYLPTGFDQLQPTAPPPSLPPPSGEAPVMQFSGVGCLSEEECRHAMSNFVAEHCCYGKAPAKDMRIEDIKPSTALHLTLETFTESRNSTYKYEPFYGGMIDGPHNGRAPGPWEIPFNADSFFNNHTKKTRVPHTESVSMCHFCWGRGFTRCRHCFGKGHERCTFCHGSGHRTGANGEHEHCHSCGGDGRKRCTWCHGDGRVRCGTCQGYRQLKNYVQLVVSFTNHLSDFILEGSDMPETLVRDVSGVAIYEQDLPQVWPITSYPVQRINENSVRLIESHRVSFPNERILRQRHRLRGVPVTECAYNWKDKHMRFWVYGLEQKVHCPDYPQQCCCGCTIL
ncbi:protein SSUH2 homolog [Tubulanus polymorphus]|uniref:protein SSUH2 homolog n=1 Tax=Tubulanus polymorphus TaxID=672921 RepID=UPI003DA5B70B